MVPGTGIGDAYFAFLFKIYCCCTGLCSFVTIEAGPVAFITPRFRRREASIVDLFIYMRAYKYTLPPTRTNLHSEATVSMRIYEPHSCFCSSCSLLLCQDANKVDSDKNETIFFFASPEILIKTVFRFASFLKMVILK